MGFRNGAYATVWESEKAEKYVNARISTSRKNKETGEYAEDFSGYVHLYGKAKEKGSAFVGRERIKVTECDVTTHYDKEKDKKYTNFNIYDFEMANKPDEGAIQNVDELIGEDKVPF